VANEQVKKTVTVNTSDTAFPKCLYFNRFSIEKIEGGHVLASFGFQFNGWTVDECSCLFTRETVINHRERNLPYIDRLPSSDQGSPKWTPSHAKGNVEVVDVYNCAHSNSIAEISTWRFLMHMIAAAPAKGAKNNVLLNGAPVLLLRSDLAIHAEFLKALELTVSENESAD